MEGGVLIIISAGMDGIWMVTVRYIHKVQMIKELLITVKELNEILCQKGYVIVGDYEYW